jgi:hypothetical protein
MDKQAFLEGYLSKDAASDELRAEFHRKHGPRYSHPSQNKPGYVPSSYDARESIRQMHINRKQLGNDPDSMRNAARRAALADSYDPALDPLRKPTSRTGGTLPSPTEKAGKTVYAYEPEHDPMQAYTLGGRDIPVSNGKPGKPSRVMSLVRSLGLSSNRGTGSSLLGGTKAPAKSTHRPPAELKPTEYLQEK